MAFRGNPLLGYWHRMSMNPTKAEAALEPAVAALGEPYRFQYPFMPIKYFADFALIDRKLIIEVDGESHDKPDQKEKDLQHELQVLKMGWIVARVTNEEAFTDPVAAVASSLAYYNLFETPLDKALLAQELTESLAQLHQDYPHLLAVAARKAKRRRQSGLVGAAVRRAHRRRVALGLGPE